MMTCLQRQSGTHRVDGGKHDFPLIGGVGLIGSLVVLGKPRPSSCGGFLIHEMGAYASFLIGQYGP